MKSTGRFLQPVDDERGTSKASLYRILDGKALRVKVKMNLRQKSRVGKSNSSAGAPGKNTDASSKKAGKRRAGAESEMEAGKKKDGEELLANIFDDALIFEASRGTCSGEEMSALVEADGDDVLFDDILVGNLDELEQELDEGGGADQDLFESAPTSLHPGLEVNAAAGEKFVDQVKAAKSKDTGEYHASVDRKRLSLPQREQQRSSTSMHQQQLLDNVRFSHGRAQRLAAEHTSSAAIGRLDKTVGVPNSLNALGRDLFSFFTGINPASLQAEVVSSGTYSSAAASAAVNDGDYAPNQKPRKRTGMIGYQDGSPSASPGLSVSLFDKLRDVGLPVALCTVITSLLDATNPHAPDRYLTSADAEADLGRMVSNPDRYLFDPPMNEHNGSLYFTPNRLYGRAKEWEQVESSFDKIVVAQEETHGYLLISGPPGR
jgi:hypothetical protein